MWLRSNVGGSAGQRISGGVLGGMAGGLVFGAMMGMMGMMGMLSMIANIVGSDSAGAGFLYHMFNSAVIGAIFGLVLGTLSHTYDGRGAGLGLLYGAMGWVLGPLVLMPLMRGMSGPQFGTALSPLMVMSLMGHLIFGLLTGLVYAAYAHGRAGVAREA